MDFDSLRNQVSNLTLYDLKAGVRKVQNAVMNLTEMESKVREATNADPWGAPSSLMMEIAQGTHNYQQLNEIMPMIYKRFTDKTAEEWRQIYKALQLLEFLVKNGSERVIDDARNHLSLLRMLRQFHYIDPSGKDQGINVRNRSQELAKLLSDVDSIRAERKKARSNKNKYGGVEGGTGLGFSSGSSRYGGFGSESAGYGGYTGEVYGDGGGFGGQETDFSGTQRRGDQFEEYDEGDAAQTSRPAAARTTAPPVVKRDAPAPETKAPEQDLFDFGDEEPISKSSGKGPATGNFGNLQTGTADDDDDFDDFQSAAPAPAAAAPTSTLAAFAPPPVSSTTTSSTQFAQPKPLQANQASNFDNIFSTVSPPPSTASPAPLSITSSLSKQSQAQQPPSQQQQYRPTGPNYYTSVPVSMNTTPAGTPATLSARPGMTASQPSYSSSTSAASLGKPMAKPKTSGGGDAFGSLWSTASTKAGVQSKGTASKGPDLASMAKAKSEAGIWGAPATSLANATYVTQTSTPTGQPKPAASLGNGLDDLLG